MASPAEIMQPLPDTLPEDFCEWDSGLSSATVPVNPGRLEVVTDVRPAPAQPEPVAPAPRAQAAPTPRETVAPAQREPVAPTHPDGPTSSQIKVLAVLDGATPAPLFSATGFYAAQDDPSRLEREALKRAKIKKVALSVVAVISIVLLLVIVPLRYPGLLHRQANVKQSIADPSSEMESSGTTRKPSPATLQTKGTQPDANALKLVSATQPSQPAQSAADPASSSIDAADEDTTQPVEPTMMNAQLAAPNRIPHDINVVPKSEEPPSSSFGVAGTEGLGNSSNAGVGTAFGGADKGPKVKVFIPAKVSLASSVSAALLVQKTMPIYPAIARSANVFGIVVLDATISKAGIIESLRVVAGPAMLRQAALDAVKSWRYKPYMINGEAVQVETTINVAFTIPTK